jgi:hypothetical protein
MQKQPRVRRLGTGQARSELITPFANCPGLSEAHQIDVIHRIHASDRPPNGRMIFERDPLRVLPNITAPAGMVKGRRCDPINIGRLTVLVEFNNDNTVTFPRIPIEKTTNGMKFVRSEGQ